MTGAREPGAATLPAPSESALIQLARVLGDPASCAPPEAAPGLARAVRRFVDASAVIFAVEGREEVDPIVAVDSSADLLITSEDTDAVLAALDHSLTAEPRSSVPWIDLRGRDEVAWLEDGRGCRTVLAVPLAACDRSRAALFILSRHQLELSEVTAIGLGLAAATGSSIAARAASRGDLETRQSAALMRLNDHAERSAHVQDLTGNGIAVAVGWLDALLGDALDEEGRHRAVSAAQRRLHQVRNAVDELVESTARSIIEVDRPESVDLSEVWREAHRYGATVQGSGSPVVLSRVGSLRQFLAHAGAYLVPEIRLDRERASLEITDPVRLDLRARTLLWASEGVLHQRGAATLVAWQLAHPWG